MSQRLVVVLLLWLSVMMPLWAAERVALVIGNSAYQHAPLRNPINDASDLAAALRAQGFSTVLKVTDADLQQMRRALREFREALVGAELGVFYYAGHGAQFQGENYLIPLQATIGTVADLDIEALSAEQVLRQMESAGHQLNIVILDACRDNPYPASSRSGTRGLARVERLRGGALIAFATAPGQVAEDGRGRNSPYAQALLQHLAEPIPLAELFNRVGYTVSQSTRGQQVPWYQASPLPPIQLAGGSVRTDEPAAPAHRGQLTITSQPPGAQLYLDGALLGTAPQTLSAPAQGREQVQIEARLTGYAPRQERIWLRAGQDSRLRLLLQAETPAVEPEPRWINTAQANVRSGPGTSHGVVTQLVQGTEVLWLGVSDQDSVWQRIRLDDGREAYIHGGLLSTQAVAALPPPTPPTERPTAPSAPASATTGSLIAPSQRPAPGHTFRDCPHCPEMVVLPAGRFRMGSPDSEPNRHSDEGPVRTVTISQPLAMGKTPVTQGQWRAVMGTNPSHFSSCGDDCPVERVSWNDAQEYIRRLNQQTGQRYRLPSEAEWEYACRAGQTHRYCGSDDVDAVGWYRSNSNGRTQAVGGKRPNAWGLYDMSGNVWEWTQDCWNDNYRGAPSDGRAWEQGNCRRRVVRGGSWNSSPFWLRSAYRTGALPMTVSTHWGFVSPGRYNPFCFILLPFTERVALGEFFWGG